MVLLPFKQHVYLPVNGLFCFGHRFVEIIVRRDYIGACYHMFFGDRYCGIRSVSVYDSSDFYFFWPQTAFEIVDSVAYVEGFVFHFLSICRFLGHSEMIAITIFRIPKMAAVHVNKMSFWMLVD
jgi:hypothetical protein